MKRALALGLMLLATTVSATELTPASTRESLGSKPQWAPSGNSSALHTRAVFSSEFRSESRPYARESRETTAGSGIFLSRDSFPGELTSPMSLQRYVYAHGNPLRYTDPDGREIADCPEDMSSMVVLSRDPKFVGQIRRATRGRLCEVFDQQFGGFLPAVPSGGLTLLSEEIGASARIPSLGVVGGEEFNTAYSAHFITPEKQFIDPDGTVRTQPAQLKDMGIVWTAPHPQAALQLGLDALFVTGLGQALAAENLAAKELQLQRQMAKQGGNWAITEAPLAVREVQMELGWAKSDRFVAIDSSVLQDMAPRSLGGRGLITEEQLVAALEGRRPVVGAQVHREFVVQAPGGPSTARLAFLNSFLRRQRGVRGYVTQNGVAAELQERVAAARGAYRGAVLPRVLGQGDARVLAEALGSSATPVITSDLNMVRTLNLLRGDLAVPSPRPIGGAAAVLDQPLQLELQIFR